MEIVNMTKCKICYSDENDLLYVEVCLVVV